ncbi:XdhC family protein [Cryptosporangium sp. NPDC048952]|uniref:XdhC family protein n=1 Tax=Cryptosporangium sp. NPDC048952 TaxID=3363961 RepID=UPI003724B1FD
MNLLERAAELAQARKPYVKATVVRAGKPASAHAGDTALVLADGAIEGFVGGTCAESSVRVHALATLDTGDPLLLRISAGAPSTVVEEGAVTVANPCLSGGSLEIFLEPRKPAPRLVVVGDTPIGVSLATLGAPLGFEVIPAGVPDPGAAGASAGAAGLVAAADAVVVASHGRGEEPVLEAALRAGVPYVGLVASRKRGSAVLASLEVSDTERARVHSPAGLDLGGRSAPEIALSILAEIVALRSSSDDATRRTTGGEDPVPITTAVLDSFVTIPAGTIPLATIEAPGTAIDPICGMTVAIVPGAIQADGPVYFCAEGCKRRYLADRG